jgi:two-component system phosphate regulon sensor histidine kinase PhoR
MWQSRTFWRFFLASAVLIVAAIGLLGLVVVGRVEKHSLEQLEETLRARAVLVRNVVQGRPTGELQERVGALGREIATRITVIAADGTVLADSEKDPQEMVNHLDRPEVQSARTHRFGTATRTSDTLGVPMMYAALRVTDGSSNAAFVRVALTLDRVQDQLAWYRRVVWTAALATAAGALALAFWLARRISRPIRELTEGAERIAAGGYGHKVYAVGRDEIAALGRAFNSMSEHLEEQFTQLAEDRQQLRMILSGMVEGVVALDGEQRVVFANERAAQLLGFSPKAVVGRRLWEVVRRSGLQEVVQRALAGPEPSRQELSWSGTAIQNVTVHAARLEGTPPRGAVLVLHDTTDLRRLERLRRDFVANVSHELKTPLSIIKACVETLLEGAAEDPQHRGPFLQQIADQGDRLHALILDLLSLARIEAGTEVFEFQEVPLTSVVEACLERHRRRAEAKKQTLEAMGFQILDFRFQISDPSIQIANPSSPVEPPNLKSQISSLNSLSAWADPEAVQEILDNLVDNAVKYTPEGGHIRVGCHAEDGVVCFQVEDSGIGIPEQDLPRIFERFYRVDKARSRELGGTGLGLSIVKHLAQAMHGSVGVASEVGKGTTFTVRLPRAPVA